MRTRWQNLDWLEAAERAWIERQLDALGGKEAGLDAVEFVGPIAAAKAMGSQRPEFEVRILGKCGKSRITAIRRGPSARDAFEATLGAFVSSAEWTLASLTPSDPVPQAEPQGSWSPRERLVALRSQAWSRLPQPGIRVRVPSVQLPQLPSVRLPREQITAAASRVRELSRSAAQGVRSRLDAVELPDPRMPRLSLPRFSMADLRALRVTLPRWQRAIRSGAWIALVRERMSAGAAYGRRMIPATAAIAGFSVIGLAAFQGESFTGRTLPPEPAPSSQAAYYAVVESFTLGDLEASSFRAVARPALAEDFRMITAAPPEAVAFSARATPALLADLDRAETAYRAVADEGLLEGESVFRALAR